MAHLYVSNVYQDLQHHIGMHQEVTCRQILTRSQLAATLGYVRTNEARLVPRQPANQVVYQRQLEDTYSWLVSCYNQTATLTS